MNDRLEDTATRVVATIRNSGAALSLQARVALVSGVVAALVAVTLGIAYTALLDTTGSRQFDETVSSMGVAVAQPAEIPPHLRIPPLLELRSPGAALPGVLPPEAAVPSLPLPGAAIPGLPPPGAAVPSDAPSGSAVPCLPLPRAAVLSLSPPGAVVPGGAPSGSAVADLPPPGAAVPVIAPPGSALPGFPLPAPAIAAPGDVRTTVEGMPGLIVRLEPDRSLVDSAIRRSQLTGLAIGLAGILVAAVLGWFLAGYAARPLRRLATATHGIETLEQLPPLSGRGAREAEELSDAITRMLTRLEAAHGATNRALASARDFAAVCAHELRTPLTAMRTDLEVLATKDLPAEQQRTVLSDVLLAERQIENTLTDLERLAVGELTESDAFEPFELCETLDRAVQNARRRHPEVQIDLTECSPTLVTGLPGGLMLIVTNAVANAVQHGHARTITVAARRLRADKPSATSSTTGGTNYAAPTTGDPNTDDPTAGVEILIDDDGTGIRSDLRPDAFDRFVKGPGSHGSGLGLALVRQQAELHSGTAELDHSPLGGTRLRVWIATPESQTELNRPSL
ncbi:sensor histidine kinase [Nocardia sp. NBC_00403]|uniref:sensor histidine kinase n=1 Tax=Nocardia sp. NBC_00403 TaxID=2975990 RepID=UPI002E1B1F48